MIERERTLWRRIRRRFGSSRASVFLEYAVVLPLVVLMISALIEFAAFWDAKIMANHAAWTCARIASVEAGVQTNYVDAVKVNRLKTKGMTVATTVLMSTCSMGSMHGSSTEFTKDWFNKIVFGPLEALIKSVKESISKKLTEVLSGVIGKMFGDDAVSQIVKKIVTLISDKIFSPLEKLLVNAVDKLFKGVFEFIGGLMDGNRQLRQLAYAAGRMAEFKDIITVTERNESPFVFYGKGLVAGDTRLAYPRCLDAKASCDDWFVTSDSPWPPNGQRQRMIDVKIAWPFERAWMFPVLSVEKAGASGQKLPEGVPTAVGRAMFYPQPMISNDNLKSEGAKPYDPGNTNAIPDVVKEVMDKYIGFMKVAALYYHYQQTTELVGPYDSDYGSRCHKGVGVGVSGDIEKSKYYQNDGLVFWMDRAPKDTKSKSEWNKKTRPADYYQCWKNISGESEEGVRFWKGIAFHAIKTDALDNFLYQRYHGKEWFYWGDGSHRHLRQKHVQPITYGSRFKFQNDYHQAFLTDLGEAKCVVSKDAYEQRMKTAGTNPAADYGTYAKMRDKSEYFTSCVRSMVRSCRSEQENTVFETENAAAHGFLEVLPGQEQKTSALISACSKELDDAVGGKSGSGSPDAGSGFFDFGMDDDEIMKNPQKAAEIIQKKLDELKPKVYAAIQKVDTCEQAVRDLDGHLGSDLDALVHERREVDLVNFAVSVGQSIVEADGSTDPNVVLATLRRNHTWGGTGPIEESNSLKALYEKYRAALIELYNAEIELGKVLNCKAAKDVTPRKPDVDPPIEPPDPDPDRPSPSSPESGSDNDNGGNAWKYQKDKGWLKK